MGELGVLMVWEGSGVSWKGLAGVREWCGVFRMPLPISNLAIPQGGIQYNFLLPKMEMH